MDEVAARRWKGRVGTEMTSETETRGPGLAPQRNEERERRMREQVRERLAGLEREHGIRVVYACEAGSRAWGFASGDSDFDVRFLYVRPQPWYLGVTERKDGLDFPVEGALDFAGWDVKKALRLFLKSNGALLEWLYSPVVYREDDDVMSLWRSLVPDVLNPKALASHYLGMCRRTWLGALQSESVVAKRYLYALRGLMAASWVVDRRGPAPVRFLELRAGVEVPDAVDERIEALLEAKCEGEELGEIEPDAVLHGFLERGLEDVGSRISEMPSRFVDVGLLDAFFVRVLGGVEETERVA